MSQPQTPRWPAAKRISPAELRAEGVLDVGTVSRTALLYVQTERGLHLFRADDLPERKLDVYGIELMQRRLDLGYTVRDVSIQLGVDKHTIQRELRRVGYKRKSTTTYGG